ncbi:hypothetical protein L3049_15880 [Labilibaculum sp. DW002]|uniref:Uncharacterized protein n=1 Tax=Paralabilibaculum antarcticum TaxID=2912572 RepID=A0ABT5VY76_9BACT|nr:MULTISPECIES: hypothetical protein [unclassified Labilibaculum]MBI9059250.1 hypothetical protein [Labilibaculum sp.]MDE5419473.1 hypothetical protein [Labilibaculum sp. DW002]
MKRYYIIFLFLFISGLSFTASAQSDVTLKNCTKYLEPNFISDGQQYKALLSGAEVAEFHTTFYANNYYRIVGATGKEEKNVIFSIYDEENHLLFSNKDHQNSPYWDFQFDHSINCTIEAKLNQKEVSSGFILLLIGFRQ